MNSIHEKPMEANSDSGLEAFIRDMDEHMRWTRLFVTIQEIAEDNEELICDLSTYNPSVTIPLLAGFLTLPAYQSHCIRFEILVVLAVTYCRGRKEAKINQVVNWFSLIGKSRCVAGEDPAEDVFVSLVRDDNGDYRLLNGVWEGAGFYTQCILDVVATMPSGGPFEQIKRSVRALLTVSEILCEKSGLQRYQLGSSDQHSTLSSHKLPERDALISRVSVTFDELNEYGIQRSDIEPFLLHPQMKEDLPKQLMGGSYLESYPFLVQANTYLVVTLPSTLSNVMRDYVIFSLIRGNLTEVFDKNLVAIYTKLLGDTPLLGGPLRAPVRWRKAGKHQWSKFGFKADEGYYISFHLFLPSVQTHTDGGFKGDYPVENVLFEALQKSVDNAVKHLTKRPDFKEGLIIIVGCGWGKGCTMREIECEHPQWCFQNISIDDLVRLSYLSGMTPHYFWRIQAGLETIEKAGVEIVNLNGILNLIGWVRHNNGHFVPHAELSGKEISPEYPLTIYPPTNLLRKVRADSDHGRDRHSSIDNTGTWHDVQHISPDPLFTSKSAQRVFASLDNMRDNRILTSVYEGAFRFWISVAAPHVTRREVEYRLWEMANEWLHRIGNVLDTRIESATKICKVYVEFLDTGPPDRLSKKPTLENLAPLCTIEAHGEPNACKAIFKAGFFIGFSIAENVAERLFVRNLIRAFLKLLGMDDNANEIRAIESLVVPNNEARSFHIFGAPEFIDCVQDTLPEELISVDPIDDAAIKIGLSWRTVGRNRGNKIEGREKCTSFLGKVVDVLLDEILDSLSMFDRLSTLKRLVANCEKANFETRGFEKTSAAILGLHGHDSETVGRVVKEKSEYAVAGMAGRILIEIALCTCPLESGAKLSNIEMGKLLAYAALVVRMGEMSDAIYYNALIPEMRLSALGDILFFNEFGREVVEPMLSRMTGDIFVARAPLQKKNYEMPRIAVDASEVLGDEFVGIWEDEMGFDFKQAGDIMGAIEAKGIDEHNSIIEMTKDEYLRLVCSDTVPITIAKRFLDQFSLVPRPQWKEPPRGFEKDIYPWLFARRLSFIPRPILQVDNSDNPLLVIAPMALRKGFLYVLDGAHSGLLRQSFFRTKKMKNFWKSTAREGHSFNREVAHKLSDAGWRIQENIKLPKILNRGTGRDYGDIDVLAWKPGHKQVLIIECKDLSPARNYSEIAALLSSYQGLEINGKADQLRKHLNRVSLLQENIEQLGRFVTIPNLQIVSCLVCRGVVPMQYAKIDALAGTHVGTIEEVLGEIMR